MCYAIEGCLLEEGRDCFALRIVYVRGAGMGVCWGVGVVGKREGAGEMVVREKSWVLREGLNHGE